MPIVVSLARQRWGYAVPYSSRWRVSGLCSSATVSSCFLRGMLHGDPVDERNLANPSGVVCSGSLVKQNVDICSAASAVEMHGVLNMSKPAWRLALVAPYNAHIVHTIGANGP